MPGINFLYESVLTNNTSIQLKAGNCYMMDIRFLFSDEEWHQLKIKTKLNEINNGVIRLDMTNYRKIEDYPSGIIFNMTQNRAVNIHFSGIEVVEIHLLNDSQYLIIMNEEMIQILNKHQFLISNDLSDIFKFNIEEDKMVEQMGDVIQLGEYQIYSVPLPPSSSFILDDDVPELIDIIPESVNQKKPKKRIKTLVISDSDEENAKIPNNNEQYEQYDEEIVDKMNELNINKEKINNENNENINNENINTENNENINTENNENNNENEDKMSENNDASRCLMPMPDEDEEEIVPSNSKILTKNYDDMQCKQCLNIHKREKGSESQCLICGADLERIHICTKCGDPQNIQHLLEEIKAVIPIKEDLNNQPVENNKIQKVDIKFVDFQGFQNPQIPDNLQYKSKDESEDELNSENELEYESEGEIVDINGSKMYEID